MTDLKRMEVHSHSHYSNIRLLDSINKPKNLIQQAADYGLAGIALTDHECLSGAIDFLEAAAELKEKELIPNDFKVALGNEIYLVNDRSPGQKYFHFILIAKDTLGFRALAELSSKSWMRSYRDRGMQRVPTLKTELAEIVQKYPGHLIATTACLGGECAYWAERITNGSINEQNIAKKELSEFLRYCNELFGDDFYFEIAPAKSKEQIELNTFIKTYSALSGTKIVCGTDAHYLTAADRFVHKMYLNSNENPNREVDAFYAFAHLMDNEEAFNNLYPYYNETEFAQLCDNSMEIYDKVQTYDLYHSPILPEEDVIDYPKADRYPEYPAINKMFMSDSVQDRYWINECIKNTPNDKVYLDRVNTEADVLDYISQKIDSHLTAYHNTIRQYIDLFWQCGSIVGVGRGSACGFSTNYALGITQLDPIKWGLNYWRYLNKERAELP